jgi:signal transduction histidine kinase
MRDAFVATVSHELRTPLTSISGFLEMMQDEEAGLGTSGRQYLEVIRRSTSRLHALVEDLLLVAQIEAKRIELLLAPVDVADLARRSAELVRPAATEKNVTVDVVADHAPELLADGPRLRQVLDNLVSNAVKFTPEGGRVELRAARRADAVELSVSDTGMGIPREELPRLFGRFFRTSSATENGVPGTGLGLAISQAIAEAHGTAITVESVPDEGATFRLLLSPAR